jgi:hypothetical protein
MQSSMNAKAGTEGVIIIYNDESDDVPSYMVRKNGAVQYFKLTPMAFGDHAELWGAEKIQTQ